MVIPCKQGAGIDTSTLLIVPQWLHVPTVLYTKNLLICEAQYDVGPATRYSRKFPMRFLNLEGSESFANFRSLGSCTPIIWHAS